MATSSFFTDIIIRDDETARKFIDALEESMNEPEGEPSMSVKEPLSDTQAIRKLMREAT